MQTFAQYLINEILKPVGIEINKPIDKGYFKNILIQVHKKAPDKYDSIVSALKKIGDKFSTLDGNQTIGMDEITLSSEKKKQRDKLLYDYHKRVEKAKTDDEKIELLGKMQDKLVDLTYKNAKDDLAVMIKSSMGGKKFQAVKLKTSPGVVKGNDGNIVPIIFQHSYSEGSSPIEYWLNAVESRQNLSAGQTSTSLPGAMSKVFNNTMGKTVVSMRDCGTTQGI